MSVPIEQAFTPAREIDDPERFAGRATILNDLALAIEGGHIVIFGSRGLGKSSVGRQLVFGPLCWVVQCFGHAPDEVVANSDSAALCGRQRSCSGHGEGGSWIRAPSSSSSRRN
jgi:hypothetical protein